MLVGPWRAWGAGCHRLATRRHVVHVSRMAFATGGAGEETEEKRAADKAGKAKRKKRRESQMCGVDEAGRGALLGPLVIGAVVLTKGGEKLLAKAGVKDSKKLSQKRREQLYATIKEHAIHCETLHLSAAEIDERREKGENLNQIELLSMLQLLFRVRSHAEGVTRLILDSIESKATKWAAPFRTLFRSCTVTSMNGADDKFIACGAASILAKVERDRAMEELSASVGVSLGSGYPSDPHVKRHVDDLLLLHPDDVTDLPEYVRHTWKIKQAASRE